MKILIVEDNEDSLCLLETAFGKSGYEVVSARNGVEALEKLRKNSIDMIVSDILMPEMDGFEFCRECKKDDSLKRVPFVFYTATYTDEKDEEFALSLGAEKFIVKPCEINELLRVLEAVIEGYRNAAPVASKISINDEETYLAKYNKRLVEKLEKKVLDLEKEVDKRKRLEETLEVRARQQAIVAYLGHKALLCKDLTDLMNDMVRIIADILDNEYCKVLELLPDGRAMLLRAGVGWKEGLVGHVTVNAGLDSQAGYTLHSSRPVIVEDIRTEKRFSGPPLLHEHNVVSGMSVIIHGEKGPWGVLGAHTTQHISYSKDDINFLQAMANILADVIARKQDEEALQASEERLRSLSRATFEGIVFNKKGVFLDCNEQFADIVGYKLDELVGIDGLTLVHPEDRELARNSITTDNEEPYELRLLCKDGSIKFVEAHAQMMLVNGERLRVTAFRDITERKKTEDMLREQKKALEQKNIALSEILGQIEIEKKQIKDNVIANAENLLLPIIQKLRLKGESRKYVQLLRKNLQELTSSFGARLTEKRANLTTREIEICNMIKNGLTNKEISRLLNISLGTTEKHRNNIRKKLHIVNKDINLSSFLNTL